MINPIMRGWYNFEHIVMRQKVRKGKHLPKEKGRKERQERKAGKKGSN